MSPVNQITTTINRINKLIVMINKVYFYFGMDTLSLIEKSKIPNKS